MLHSEVSVRSVSTVMTIDGLGVKGEGEVRHCLEDKGM